MAEAGFDVHVTSRCDPIAAGDEATMEITVTTPETHTGIELQWEVGWTAKGRTTDRHVVSAGREPIAELVADEPRTFTIVFEIPSDGPITYAGSLLTVAWFAKVSLDVPWAIDPKSTFAIEVGPRLVKKTTKKKKRPKAPA